MGDFILGLGIFIVMVIIAVLIIRVIYKFICKITGIETIGQRKERKAREKAEEEIRRAEAEEKAAAERAAAEEKAAAAKAREKMFSGLGSVPVKHRDGTVEMVPNYYRIEGEEYLISGGGKTYHTHVGCFTHWPKEYQENFNGWELITIEEAKARGLTKCKRCEEADERAEDDTRDIADVLDEIEEEERELARAEREEERELYE